METATTPYYPAQAITQCANHGLGQSCNLGTKPI